MKTPKIPNDTEFIPRQGTAAEMARFSERFVGDTLFNAAEQLANSQDLEIEDLIELSRPLNIELARPTEYGHREYEFFVCIDDEVDEPGAVALEYVLSRADTETTPLGMLDTAELESIRKALAKDEEANEELLYFLSLDPSSKVHESVMVTKQYRTYYQCSQLTLDIEKNVETTYSIDGTQIATISYDSDEELNDADDPEHVLLKDHLMDISVIEPDDIATLREILYYLNLPGGTIETDITGRYLDDPRVVYQ